jgi:hypothetical protein
LFLPAAFFHTGSLEWAINLQNFVKHNRATILATIRRYENFPVWIVILSNLVAFLIYGLGFLVLHRLGLLFSVGYLVYVLALEFRLLRNHCTNCYYWGKTCGFGKGRLSSLLFKKGDIAKFCDNNITWKDMIPDVLVTLIPLGAGIYLLAMDFDFIILSILFLLVFLTTMGNGFVRGTLTCRHCKQKELGCPADLLFNKGKEQDG